MTTISAASGVFVANNRNLVVIEAEAAPATGGWQYETQYGGYTGTGYYRWSGRGNITAPDKSTALSYTVNLATDGLYSLSLRALRNGILEGRNVEGDNENDFWVRVNGGDWTKIVFYGEFGEWNWATTLSNNHNLTPAQYNLTAGLNIIEVAGRSKHAMLDRIHLTSTGRFLRDETQPQSQNIGGSANPPTTNGINDVVVTENNITTVIDLFAAFDDIEDQDKDLTYAVTSNSNSNLVSTSINTSTGKLTLTYAANAEGSSDLVVRATDKTGLSVSTGFKVTIDLPEPPVTEPPVTEPPVVTDPPEPEPPVTPPNPQPPKPPTSGNPNSPSPTPNDPISSDILMGTAKGDRLVGTTNNDTIKGLGGKDKIAGKAGDDIIYGGGGKDKLKGNNGNDKLYGEAGNDKLIGGDGDDLLDGGKGRDVYKGGKGADTFVVSTGKGFAVIKDFDRSEGDRIGVRDLRLATTLDIIQDGRTTLLVDDGDILAKLKGAPDIRPSDIVFI